jgi:hypothetical protein
MKPSAKQIVDTILIAAAVAAFVVFGFATCAMAAEEATLTLQPVDITMLIEKLGGWAVVAVLLVKLIFNDISHMNNSLNEMNKSLRLLIRLQAEHMGKNPDVVEATEAVAEAAGVNQ